MQRISSPETPPRFYQLWLQKDLITGWSLVKENGTQGYAGRISKEHFDNREDAETAMLSVRDKQVNRGYQVMFVQGQTEPEHNN